MLPAAQDGGGSPSADDRGAPLVAGGAAPTAEELARIEAGAVAVARAAGVRALEAFAAPRALEFKGQRLDDPVTVADREIETLLREELRSRFPGHGLVGEEQADTDPGADFVWVLDPVDGTANFAAGLPLWGVSLGLLHRGVPVVGCIWVPVGPRLSPGVYHARAGGGARFDGEPIAVAQSGDERGRIGALPGRYWAAFRLRRPPPGAPRAARALPDHRSLGSITAELALVASGVLRTAVFVQPRLWDVAAGALLVQEAGGRVLVWRERGWRPLAAFAPVPPEAGQGEPALRHWTQPLVVGAPEAVERLVGRLAWHPRLPRRLQRLIGEWAVGSGQ